MPSATIDELPDAMPLANLLMAMPMLAAVATYSTLALARAITAALGLRSGATGPLDSTPAPRGQCDAAEHRRPSRRRCLQEGPVTRETWASLSSGHYSACLPTS